MIKRLSVWIVILATLGSQSHAAGVPESIELGKIQPFKSKQLAETRSISVYLPPSYQLDRGKRYPVFFCLDGETHYKAMVGTLDWLSRSANVIPEHIVVAIHNAPGMRNQDMVAQGGNHQRSAGFQKFLIEELIPFIDKTYPTQPFRILSGHSLGGVFALNILQEFPNQFQAYLISSPYFAVDSGQSIASMKSVLPTLALKQTFLYASLGTEAGLRPFYEQWIDVLKDNAPANLTWQAKIFDGESHMTTPLLTIHAGLKSLYEDINPGPSSELMQKDVASIQNHFQALSKNKYGFEVSAENALTQKGITTAQGGDVAGGIRILRTTAATYPQSWKVQLGLSHLLEAVGQLSDALDAATTAQKLATTQERTVTQALADRVASLKNKMQHQ